MSKSFFNFREEHGAGDDASDKLVNKYKADTPGQGGDAGEKKQKARKGDMLQNKDEPEKSLKTEEVAPDPIILEGMDQKKFSAGAKAMKAYAQKYGGVDKKDFMEVSKLLDQIGRVNILQAGQILSRLNRLVDGMDTDVRERIFIELKKVGLVESVNEEAELKEGRKLRNVLSDNELKKSMQKALADKGNYKGGKVNWNFIDADVYMDLSAKGYDLRHPNIKYMDRFEAMADKLDPEIKESVELDEALGTSAKHAGKKGMFGGKYTSKDHMIGMRNFSKIRDKRAKERDAEHAKQDPKMRKMGYAKHMLDTDKADAKARKRGIDPTGKYDKYKKKNGVREELDEAKYTDKQIKMAYGVANDPRYKGGNMTGAARAIEKIAKGLSKHPSVQKVLRVTNEDTDIEAIIDALIEEELTEMAMLEENYEESSMMQNQIDAMEHFLDGIDEYIDECDDCPEWFQNKLTMAFSQLQSLYAYATGEMGGEEDEMEESTKAYGDTMRKQAREKQLNTIKDREKEKLMKIRQMLDKEKKK